MHTCSSAAIIIVAFVAGFVTSQSLLIPKQVDRMKAGDVFQPNPGKKCTDIRNAENHSSINTNVCKCKSGTNTLYFDFNNEDSCYASSDTVGQTTMFFQGTNGQVALVGWDNTNKQWNFVQRPIIHENGTLFDFQSCSQRIELELWEYTNYNFSYTKFNDDIFKPAVPDRKFTFEFSASGQNKKDKSVLQGRLFDISWSCDKSGEKYFTSVKFAGREEYYFGKTPPSPTAPPTPETTEEETTQAPPDYVIVERGLDRDRYSLNGPDEYQNCDWGNPMYALTPDIGDLGCTNLTAISDAYQAGYNTMLKYVGPHEDGDKTSTYTIFIKNNEWTEPKQYDWRLRFLQNSELLISSDACSNGELRIKEIQVLTFDGWKVWTKLVQNYFTLVKHDDNEVAGGETTSSFSLTFNYFEYKYYRAFLGHLFDIQMDCFGSGVYHLFVKFEGSRTYTQGEDNFEPPTHKQPIQTTQSPTPPIKNPPSEASSTSDDNVPVIVGAVVGGIAFIVLLIALYCYCKARRYKGRHNGTTQLKTKESGDAVWSKTAQKSLNIPEGPEDESKKEAAEILELAKEIIHERHSAKERPDVIPRYIMGRPAPNPTTSAYQDPRPSIGPLAAKTDPSKSGPTSPASNLYTDLANVRPGDSAYESLRQDAVIQDDEKPQESYVDMNGIGGEEAYLDLEQAREDFEKEIQQQQEGNNYDNPDYKELQKIEPDNEC
ncbi:uncharacterized protein [Clytia hemisphaerica]|uniref:Cnidarian restricted protein n=1 Tax=Clytia hemisphaerica TaxID=252671 RepID=A0A7M5V0K2_9CNID|eukprot:TCONS_00003085-protein